MQYEFSKHALEQIEKRNIAIDVVEKILGYPQQIIRLPDYTIYQSIIKFEKGEFLVRVFLNTNADPTRIITVYKTSKINKYYEGEVR